MRYAIELNLLRIFRLKGYVKAFRNGLNAYSIDDLFELYDTDRQISSNMFTLSLTCPQEVEPLSKLEYNV